jgi:hypothetical protein
MRLIALDADDEDEHGLENKIGVNQRNLWID